MRTYDTYKDSGISWLGQIPSHWESRKFKFTFSERKQKGFPDEPLLAATQSHGVIPKDLYETRTMVATKGLETLKLVEKGDFVISLRSFQGGIEYAYYRGIISPAYTVLTPTAISANYFKYLGKCQSFIALLKSSVTGIREGQNIDYIKLRENLLPLPPVNEQDTIAAYLDNATAEIDKAIASQQRMVELLQERKQIIINQAVTQGLNPDARLKDTGINWLGLIPAHWEARKLKSICKYEKYSIKTGPFGTQLKGDDLMQNGAVRVYNQKNVIENSFDDVQFYVSKEKARELNSFYTQPQDLLITSRGTIGKCSILPENAPMGLLHPCLIAIRINQKICDLNWAQIFISSSLFFSTNIFLNSNATTIEVIYTDTLKNVVIPLPPLSEQQEIVAYIKREASKVDHALQQTKLKIELLTERKQILINDVVTGKIKVV